MAMRCGEAKRLKWSDIEFKRLVIRINNPEKFILLDISKKRTHFTLKLHMFIHWKEE
jgi:integrase